MVPTEGTSEDESMTELWWNDVWAQGKEHQSSSPVRGLCVSSPPVQSGGFGDGTGPGLGPGEGKQQDRGGF